MTGELHSSINGCPDYCTGDCFSCDEQDECDELDNTSTGDYDDEPVFAGDLPACPLCGELGCEGECQILEPGDDDPPLDRDDVEDDVPDPWGDELPF